MEDLTEMVQPGDPILRITMPKAIIQEIVKVAKQNKRRQQDEVIKRIRVTLKANSIFEALQKKILTKLSKI